MARTRTKKTNTQKKTGVKILHSTWAKKSQKNSFDVGDMFNALKNIGVRVTKTQRRKVEEEIARRPASTRTRTQTKFFTAPVVSRPVVSKRASTKRAVSKSTKANANPNGNVNMAAAATKTKGQRLLRAKQLPHVMKSYEGKEGMESTYAHFQGLYQFYLDNQTKYSPETDIKILEHDMKQQHPAKPVAVQLNRGSAPVLVQPVAPSDAEVDELAALFGSTGI
jgi:hypothetical protein